MNAVAKIDVRNAAVCVQWFGPFCSSVTVGVTGFVGKSGVRLCFRYQNFRFYSVDSRAEYFAKQVASYFDDVVAKIEFDWETQFRSCSFAAKAAPTYL